MIRVLVTGVGGDVAQGVIKCLQDSSIDFEIYKMSNNENSSWLYLDELSYISPDVSDPAYVSFLCDFIKQNKIVGLIPCIDSEILLISRFSKKIENETGCKVAVGSYDLVSICDDKFSTSVFLSKNGFEQPNTFLVDSIPRDVDFPLILKSRTGAGSRDVKVIRDKSELKNLNQNNLIVQEMLSGPEYTAGIYVDKKRKTKGVCILKRELKHGSTFYAERIFDEKIEKEIVEIAETLGIPYVNIQFMIKNNRPCPFEFNGRFSGTTGIIKKVFNGPEMWVRENILGEDLKDSFSKEEFFVMRYYEEIYGNKSQKERLLERSKK